MEKRAKKEKIESLKKEITELKQKQAEEKEFNELLTERNKLKFRKIVGAGKTAKKGFFKFIEGVDGFMEGFEKAGEQIDKMSVKEKKSKKRELDMYEKIGLDQIDY